MLTFNYKKNDALSARIQPWWGSWWKVLISVLLCLSVLGLSVYRYYVFQGRGLPPTQKVNLDCSPCAWAANNNTVPDYCEMPEDLQFEKIIWFITDGYPLYMQKEWLPLYANHSVPFSVTVPGKKWSHTIYTSWFTGMPNLNLLARTITGDILFQSMRRASGKHCSLMPDMDLNNTDDSSLPQYDLNWLGPLWCPIGLLGYADYVHTELNFVNVTDVIEELEQGPYPYPKIEIDSLTTTLEYYASKNQSLITHSGLIDKASHYFYPYEAYEQHLKDLFSAAALREFIDAHPDYLLIMSSDHGLSKVGNFHGDEHTYPTENIGTFVFYNPRLQGQEMTEIDVVDVHPTIAKYLKNVDISYYSVGEIRNSYGPNSTKYMANALKQNLRQLAQLVEANGDKVDRASINDLVANSQDVDALRTAVKKYKEILYNPDVRPLYPWTLAGLLIATAACVVYWIIKVNDKAVWRTLLLFLPLCMSLGFFIIIVQHVPVVQQLNVTMFIWIGLCAFVGCVFSGWRITGFILFNELLNVLGYAFRATNNALQFSIRIVPIFSTLLSYAETHYYLMQKKTPRTGYILPIVLHVLNLLYLATVDSAYVAEINVFAFLIYLSLPLAICYVIYGMIRRRFWKVDVQTIDTLTIVLTTFLILLTGGVGMTPFIPLLNFQCRQILPCLFGKAPESAEDDYVRVSLGDSTELSVLSSSSDSVSSESEKFVGDDNDCSTSAGAIGTLEGDHRTGRPSHFSLQACTIYVVMESMWILFCVWGFLPDLDVDAKNGVAGIKSWNKFPTFSGGMLGLRKFAVFPLLAVHIASLIIPNRFPYFIYFTLTAMNCFSVNLCFRLFTYTTQHEAMAGFAVFTVVQFLLVLFVKEAIRPKIADRAPLGLAIVDRIGNSAVASALIRTMGSVKNWHGWSALKALKGGKAYSHLHIPTDMKKTTTSPKY